MNKHLENFENPIVKFTEQHLVALKAIHKENDLNTFIQVAESLQKGLTNAVNSMKEQMYLEYVNDFLTVEKFAEYHNISEETAEKIINEVRNDTNR
jgi:hypothetical protein